MASVEQVVESCRSLESADRLAAIARIVEDLAAQEGRDQLLQLVLRSVYASASTRTKAQKDTVAAVLKLPPDLQERLLRPIDIDAIRDEDCLTVEEVDRIIAEQRS